MKEIVEVKEYDTEIYSKEDCIINIQNSKENMSKWIYRAYKLGEDDFQEVMEACEISERTAYNYIVFEEANELLQVPANLNMTETSLALSQGVYQTLKGKTPEEREENFQEIYSITKKLPASYEIELYNSLKSHANTLDDRDKLPEVFRYLSSASSSVKRKFRSSGNAPYTIKKLYNAIVADADESIIISLADTGNMIASKSSKADREKILKLEKENEILRNRLQFFENSLGRDRVIQLVRKIDYFIKALKKTGVDTGLIDALKTLGLELTTDEEELKRAYKREVSIHHPDKGGDADIFRKIVEANRTIKRHIERMTK